jgi:DMSO/TMAO reductase YedYZ molybdopterin-dependent catalytic subunit
LLATTSNSPQTRSPQTRDIEPEPLPVENGRPRVQRIVDQLAPVHLELEPPTSDRWEVTVTGLVEAELTLELDQLGALGGQPIVSDFHCVWGWSRPGARWYGVPTGLVLDAAGLLPAATHVRFEAFESPYAACLPLEQARDGWFALELDGSPLPQVHGGPVRWLQPSYLWGYKGVKWVGRVELLDQMEAGPWESTVGDVEGQVPQGLIDRFQTIGGSR